MIDPGDAEKNVIPTLMLASEEESAEEVVKWEEALKVEKYVERVWGSGAWVDECEGEFGGWEV
jgi:hypothetical protein